MCYEISEGADGQGLINLTWDPDDRFVPRFAGTLSGERKITIDARGHRVIKWRRLHRSPLLRRNRRHALYWLISVNSGDAA